jgi:hypothetical protein
VLPRILNLDQLMMIFTLLQVLNEIFLLIGRILGEEGSWVGWLGDKQEIPSTSFKILRPGNPKF